MLQTATRLCPPAAAAATDAALALLSGLQAARLRLPPDAPPATAADLGRCTQHLLRVLHQGMAPPTPPPAPAHAATAAPAAAPAWRRAAPGWPGAAAVAAAAAAAGDAGQRRAELSALVKGLGCTAADWQAAQAGLAQRTAAALHAQHRPALPGDEACRTLAELPGQLQQQEQRSQLERVLLAAVSTPAQLADGSGPSAVHVAAQQLLWVLRRFPPPLELPAPQRPQLSPDGWAAYWLLEPRARCWLGWRQGRWRRCRLLLLGRMVGARPNPHSLT